MNIRVKSLSHYGFVSRRLEVSGGQMEAQILCSQCAELGNGSEVPGGRVSNVKIRSYSYTEITLCECEINKHKH